MSLLMDALKKAEATKQQAFDPPSAPGATPNVPSAPGSVSANAPPPGDRLPDLAAHSDALEADLAAISAAAPPRRSAPPARPAASKMREDSERLAAQNVFSAKRTPAISPSLWVILGLAAAVALGIGAYFWWQLSAVGSLPVRPPPSLPVASSTAPSPLPPTNAAAPAPPRLAPSAMETETSSGASAVIRPPAAERIATAAKPAGEATTRFVPSRPRAAPASSGRASAGASTRPVFSRATPVKSSLEDAYEALQDNRLDEARSAYARVLAGDRHNTDALLGLATIAVRQEKLAEAQSLYQRVLAADPNDATAQAALVNLNGHGDPGLTESRLKTALANQPDSAALNFALGNLYAGQRRWSEAQQAYFGAFTNASDNPDYIFNLAVSLDNLHQRKLAAQYYQLAAHAAQAVRHASFDPELARQRARALQP